MVVEEAVVAMGVTLVAVDLAKEAASVGSVVVGMAVDLVKVMVDSVVVVEEGIVVDTGLVEGSAEEDAEAKDMAGESMNILSFYSLLRV